MMQPDVIVLGAGPAGVAVSLLLARKGYAVEIFDPASFPRHKICGEFLNPQAAEWLSQQGLLSRLMEAHPHVIYGMKIFGRNNRSFCGHYKNSQGYVVLRKNFDFLLAGIARQEGVVIREGWVPQKLLMDSGAVSGIEGVDFEGNIFQRKARVVVGADGRNNLIGRTFGWMRGIRHLRRYAFQTYFENVPDLSHYGEMHLMENGYTGIAPVTARLANVALVIDERFHPGTADWKEFLMNSISKSHLADRFKNLTPVAPITMAGPLAFETKPVSGYRTILVGDACGFIDPFTGEGINYSFLSATLACDVLTEAFAKNDFSDSILRRYDQLRKQILGKKYAISKLLQKAIARPAVADFLMHRLSKNQDLADLVVSAIGSAVPVEHIWNLRFVFQMVV